MICGIYCIENLINNKKYVGKSIDIENRFSEHIYKLNKNIHRNDYLQNAWNKYGGNNFKFYIIKKCSQDKLNKTEIYYIKKLKTKFHNGYNLTDGGEGLNNPSEDVRKKIGENHDYPKGENHPFYGLNWLGKTGGFFGNHHTQESKEKMKKARLGRKNLNETSSIYYGVCIHKRLGLFSSWDARIKLDGKRIHIKSCQLEDDAARSYDKYIVEHQLNLPLNFPEDYNKEGGL
jgi:group I intron endonuclease